MLIARANRKCKLQMQIANANRMQIAHADCTCNDHTDLTYGSYIRIQYEDHRSMQKSPKIVAKRSIESPPKCLFRTSKRNSKLSRQPHIFKLSSQWAIAWQSQFLNFRHSECLRDGHSCDSVAALHRALQSRDDVFVVVVDEIFVVFGNWKVESDDCGLIDRLNPARTNRLASCSEKIGNYIWNTGN